jgi:hypothetical protein
MVRRRFFWGAALLLIGTLACQHQQPPSSAPADPLETAHTAPDGPSEAPLDRAKRLFEAAGLEPPHLTLRDEQVQRALDAGLSEAVVLELLEEILSDCLAAAAECPGTGVLDDGRDNEPMPTVQGLFELLEEVGTDAMVPLLLRLEARGFYRADSPIERPGPQC